MDKTNKGMKSMTVTGCVTENDGHLMLNDAIMAGDGNAMTYESTSFQIAPVEYLGAPRTYSP